MLEREVDVAVCTTADCGSCCSWLMRDLCELERRGIPAVGYTAAIFDEDARFSLEDLRRARGLPADRARVLLEQDARRRSRTMVDDAMDDASSSASRRDRAIFDELPQFDAHGARERAGAACSTAPTCWTPSTRCSARSSRNGWSDGLPLVPPTHAKVDAMIDGVGPRRRRRRRAVRARLRHRHRAQDRRQRGDGGLPARGRCR